MRGEGGGGGRWVVLAAASRLREAPRGGVKAGAAQRVHIRDSLG